MREELRFDRYSDNLTCACLEYSVQLREVLRAHVRRNHFLCALTPTLQRFIVMFFLVKKCTKMEGSGTFYWFRAERRSRARRIYCRS